MTTELLILIGIFLGLSAVILVAGHYMAAAADVIGEKTGMGGSLAGLILLAAATSLPELAINIAAVRLPDSTNGVDLCMGNVLGSSLFNLMILGVVDLAFRSRSKMFTSHSSEHALAALCSMGLTAIILLFMVLEKQSNDFSFSLWHMSLGPILCMVFYIFSIRLIYRDQNPAEESEEERPAMTLSVAIGIYVLTTAAIFIAAHYLAPTADRLAVITGLGGTFVGSTFLALTTSLPEMVTTVAAVRMGAANMAIGNIFGSNAFNIAILLPVDAIYTQGSLLADASLVHAATAAAVIFITCIATMAIVNRRAKQYWLIEPDSLLVVLLVLASLWGIYELTNEIVPAGTLPEVVVPDALE